MKIILLCDDTSTSSIETITGIMNWCGLVEYEIINTKTHQVNLDNKELYCALTFGNIIGVDLNQHPNIIYHQKFKSLKELNKKTKAIAKYKKETMVTILEEFKVFVSKIPENIGTLTGVSINDLPDKNTILKILVDTPQHIVFKTNDNKLIEIGEKQIFATSKLIHPKTLALLLLLKEEFNAKSFLIKEIEDDNRNTNQEN